MQILQGVILAVLIAGGAAAQEPDRQDGEDIFRFYCWQCHGRDAAGNGPMAEMLAIETPDLTRLSARNGGAFPLELVATQIDGRSEVLAHGGTMPLFGAALEADQSIALKTASGQPLMAPVPLANLIAYLQSIQVE